MQFGKALARGGFDNFKFMDHERHEGARRRTPLGVSGNLTLKFETMSEKWPKAEVHSGGIAGIQVGTPASPPV